MTPKNQAEKGAPPLYQKNEGRFAAKHAGELSVNHITKLEGTALDQSSA